MFVAIDDFQVEHQGTVIQAKGVLCAIPISMLFDSGALDSFISSSIMDRCGLTSAKQTDRWQVELATGVCMFVATIVRSCELDLGPFVTSIDLRVIPLGSYGVVLGMDWISSYSACVDYSQKIVECLDDHSRKVGIVGV